MGGDFNIKKIQTNKLTIYKTFENPIRIPSRKGKGIRYKAKNKVKSEYESLHRTRQKVFDYALANDFDYFATFTFDREKVDDRYNLDALSKKLTTFFNHFKSRVSSHFQYLIIPEQHKDGAWHLHALIKGLPKEELTFYKHDKYGNDLFNWSRFEKSFGYNSLLSLENVPFNELVKVYGYIVKYITKDLCSFRTNKKRYWASRGLAIPKKTQYLADNESLQVYKESLANHDLIIHQNQYNIKDKQTKEIINTVSEFVLLELPF